MPPQRVSDEELIAAFGVVGSFTEVASLFGYSKERIRQRLTALGYQSEARGRRPVTPPIRKLCETCKRVFYPASDERRWCSQTCYGQSLKQYSRDELMGALKACGMNKEAAARALGIPVITFYRYLPGTRGLGRHRQRGPKATHCLRGHEYTPENTYQHPKGFRICRECQRARRRRLYAKKKELNGG